jgi:hypothetical protein
MCYISLFDLNITISIRHHRMTGSLPDVPFDLSLIFRRHVVDQSYLTLFSPIINVFNFSWYMYFFITEVGIPAKFLSKIIKNRN